MAEISANKALRLVESKMPLGWAIVSIEIGHENRGVLGLRVVYRAIAAEVINGLATRSVGVKGVGGSIPLALVDLAARLDDYRTYRAGSAPTSEDR